jgi:Kef-type K+ transport system membrane component KefB
MRRLVVPLAALLPAVAHAAGTDTPTVPVLGMLALVLVGAKLAAWAAERVGQPAVLGELLLGVALGNVPLSGAAALEPLAHDAGIALLADLGVILLLFEVGLDTSVAEMRSVGGPSALVAVLGVVAPFVLGWAGGRLLLPDVSGHVHLFLGAALTATSVGITARVLKDLGAAASREAKVILGAAVIDDVLGLVVLAVIVALITAAGGGEAFSAGAIVLIVLKAVGFLAIALVAGRRLAPGWFALAGRLPVSGVLLPASLAVCFALAWMAARMGLAPIVGAFAAGLLLEREQYAHLETRDGGDLEHALAPLLGLLLPVFFVLMGMRVDVAAFADAALLGLAAVLTAAAIVGKLACAVGAGRGIDRLSVALGMVPRGEVGLVFAGVGLGLHVAGEPVIDTRTYGAVLFMVVATTLVTPPALRWSFARRGRAGH